MGFWLGALVLLAGACFVCVPIVNAGVDPRRRTPVVEVFESARDAVVNISSTQIVEVRSRFGFDSMFNDLFDLPRPRRRLRREAIGSGFVLHEAGYIVTNAHVVARTVERRIAFSGGEEFEADVVAIDIEHDLAVLKIDPGGAQLKVIPLGTSADLMVGETVVAIGNPLGYAHTVTAGVVSALDRSLPVDDRHSFEGLIQTDASINPGNSGGPLLNILGQLVGVNTAIRADAQNIGFAIAVDQLRKLLPEMLDVPRRYGIETGLVVEPGGGTAADSGGESGGGVRVASVAADSPAERAGLGGGDQHIDAIDGRPVRNVIDYHIALIGRSPGDLVTLNVRSADGAGRQVQIRLAERPRPDGARLLSEKLGIEAQPVTAHEARRLGFRRLSGLVVTVVERGSPAERMELRRGDVIVQFGRHQVADLDEVGELLDHVRAGDEVPVVWLRVGSRGFLQYAASVHSR